MIDYKGFMQKIARTFRSQKKPITIAGIDEVHLKSDCIIGSFVIEVREHALFSFALDKPRGQGIYEKTLNEFSYIYKK